MRKSKIKAINGGSVNMKDGVSLEIPKKVLSEDTVIETQKIIYDDRVEIHLGPDGLQFGEPVKLSVTKRFLDNIECVDSSCLIGPDEVVVPGEDVGYSLVYSLDHFSIYYYRRR